VDLAVVATTFALIFPVELPDKTFVASLVLATRYRPLLVWVGVSLAFLVQCTVAVTAGGLLSLLPEPVVVGASAVLFLVGAVVLWRGAKGADEDEAEAEEEFGGKTTRDVHGLRVVATSFGVLFLAEWGDLSQLLTISLVAKYEEPLSVFVGAWAALLAVSGLAVLAGRVLLRYMRLSVLHYIGAAVCLVLAGLTLYELLR